MPPGEWYCLCAGYNPKIKPFGLEKTPEIDPGQFLALPSPLGLVIEEMVLSSLQGAIPGNPKGAAAQPSPEVPSPPSAALGTSPG